MKQLLQDAKNEIVRLRRCNEILDAQIGIVDLDTALQLPIRFPLRHHLQQLVLDAPGAAVAHANEALAMLIEPTAEERRLLGAFPYTSGRKVIVHDDADVMPRRKSAWASFTFNDRVPALDGGFAVTYWLNLIQNIDQKYPLFLSINTDVVRKERRFAEFNYTHPTFTAGSYEAQKELPKLQGVGGVYYCGSYFSYACHEDGLLSAMAVSDLLGGDIPWKR